MSAAEERVLSRLGAVRFIRLKKTLLLLERRQRAIERRERRGPVYKFSAAQLAIAERAAANCREGVREFS